MILPVQDIRRFALIAASTFTVNFLLFTGLPNLLPRASAPTGMQEIQAVDFLIEPPGQKDAVKKETPEAPPPEPPRTVPRKAVEPIHTQVPQLPHMPMPSFDLDALPDIDMGVAVSAPPQAGPPETAATTLQAVYGLEEVDQAPQAMAKPRPVYPYRARRLNLEGEVDVKFLVDHDGRVSRISILRATPPNLFEQSVLQALEAWRFAPGKVDGRPVNTWVTTTIVFRMDEQ